MTADAVLELFATEEARERHPDLSAAASLISNKDAAALSETITPQGLVAVCRRVDVRLAEALDGARLVVALVEPNDPGNAGAIVRSADAAGADTIVIAGGVDIYNGKAIRASAGSVFHLRLVVDVDIQTVLDAAGELTTLAATASGASDLDELADDRTLARPTMWLFGSEARGLPTAIVAAADRTVRVPIYGSAESLNLAAAAAVCLYASARAQR